MMQSMSGMTFDTSLREAAPTPSPEALDEVAIMTGRGAETYRQIMQLLGTPSRGQLPRVTAQAARLMRDLGVTFSLYNDEAGRDNVLPFDPFPRVIDPAEWQQLSSGLAQRLRLWNEFFKDIYDSQEVLKAGLLPFEIVYDDLHYQRSVVGIPVPENTFVHLAAFDLARRKDGQWMVADDFVSNTTGAIYALQSRNVLSQVCPEQIETANVVPIHGYPTELLEHLRHFTRAGYSDPRVVLLSPGTYNEAYYEHSYLARTMGIPLVRGGDLTVLNNRVYLKTIGGLEPIDVIYRRMDDAFIDPVAFRDDSHLGIPGLMSCVRKGTITVANAVGTGLGENRAIAAHLPRLARFYLNESLILPGIERLICGDPDQCDLVVSRLTDYVVSSVSERSNHSTWFASELSAADLEALRRRIMAHPSQFVAEPRQRATLLPTAAARGLEPRHSGLRLFAFGGPKPRVFPSGLTRFATTPDSRVISSGLGGGIKDTWILRDTQTDQTAADQVATPFTAPQRRLRLGSRIADSLFWMGRYAERSENTTRIFKVLQQIQVEDQRRGNQKAWAPLWEALAQATGHPTHFFHNPALRKEQTVAHYILLDRTNPSSVLRCIESCRHNAQATRESVPPEVWVILNRLLQQVSAAAKAGNLGPDAPQEQIFDLQENIINQLDAITGCASKTMLYEDGWLFWCMGTYVERALTTVLVLRQVLLKRAGEVSSGTHFDSNLDAVLRMLSSQYAYRSLFQSRPAMEPVAMMLLQDAQLPRSVLHCLEGIHRGLQTAFGGPGRDAGHTPLRQSAQMVSDVAFADVNSLFSSATTGRNLRLHLWLDDLASSLMSLSTNISDHYLHHHAFNILR